jgi:hypothetical protein
VISNSKSQRSNPAVTAESLGHSIPINEAKFENPRISVIGESDGKKIACIARQLERELMTFTELGNSIHSSNGQFSLPFPLFN